MHLLRSIRRAALGAALAGAAIGLVPAAASANKQPTCTYNDGLRQVNVADKSDMFYLRLVVQNGEIAARNDNGSNTATVRCFSLTGSGKKATVLNTDRIVVSGTIYTREYSKGGREEYDRQTASGPSARLVSLANAAGALTPTRTVLAGLAVSSVFGAITSLVIFWSATGDSYREILNWLLGSLAGTDWTSVALAGGAVVLIGVPVLASARTLDAFAFGDTAAAALGVHVARSRAVLLTGTALLTGALVAVSGAIGFVGLILPHAVRLLVGSRHRALLPLSALAGAIFLVWVDTGARTLFDPRELPVGILTALVGGPVFALLMLRNRRLV